MKNCECCNIKKEHVFFLELDGADINVCSGCSNEYPDEILKIKTDYSKLRYLK